MKKYDFQNEGGGYYFRYQISALEHCLYKAALLMRDMCVCVEVWEEVWQEGTPGSEGGIRLYLSEIMEVLPKVNHHCWPYLDFKMRHKYRSLHFFI